MRFWGGLVILGCRLNVCRDGQSLPALLSAMLAIFIVVRLRRLLHSPGNARTKKSPGLHCSAVRGTLSLPKTVYLSSPTKRI